MENEEIKVVETENELDEQQKETSQESSKASTYTSTFIVGFIGGAATALGKCAVDWAIPKIKEASAKAAEKRKAKKEQKKLAKLAKNPHVPQPAKDVINEHINKLKKGE